MFLSQSSEWNRSNQLLTHHWEGQSSPYKANDHTKAWIISSCDFSPKWRCCEKGTWNWNLQEYYWTDSRVVLGYVNNDAKRFHTFVANRIQSIKSSTCPEQWRHVNSENNPADHASRGLSIAQLKDSNWLKGPDFLWQRDVPNEEETVGEIEITTLSFANLMFTQSRRKKWT